MEGEPEAEAYALSAILRLALGAGVALALGAAERRPVPIAGVVVGAGAPKILEQLASRANFGFSSEETSPITTEGANEADGVLVQF